MDISEQILKFAENQKTIDEKLSNSDFTKSYENGYDIGYSEGETAGYNSGHAVGVEDGKQTERDELLPTMWGAITAQGEKREYKNAFNFLWLDKTTFKPEYNIVPTNAVAMFKGCSQGLPEELQVDMLEYEEETGVILDFWSCTAISNTFYNCDLFKALGFMDLSNVTAEPRNTFANSAIQRIDAIILPDINLTYMFSNATNLSYINFDETYVYRILNLQSCPLDNESAISLINALYDYSGTENEFAYTVTLNDEVWARLDALGNVSPNGNTWREYAQDKKWNT